MGYIYLKDNSRHSEHQVNKEELIRNYIREALELLEVERILGEPDLSSEDERDEPEYEPPDEASTMAGGSIRGYVAPLKGPQVQTVGYPDSRAKKDKKRRTVK